MQYYLYMLFSIITPTTGNLKLERLLESINEQELEDGIKIEHLIVCDGPKFSEKVDKMCNLTPVSNKDKITRHIFHLPFNTGADNYFGHKIYSSIPQLVHGEYVLLIDEDNWLQPEHIQSLYNQIIYSNISEKTKREKPLDWVYSLRRIVSDDGEYICNDECESLGYLHAVFYNPAIFMIDTNCTCVAAPIIQKLAPIWNTQGFNNDNDPDRLYSRALMENHLNYTCTGQYTINYRVANREGSVKGELFTTGNKLMQKKFGGETHWHKEPLFVAHFNFNNTQRIIERIYSKNKPAWGYKQWQLNIMDCSGDRCILDAYTKYIPANSQVLFHMCNPGELPRLTLDRTDIEKILYTIESPNIRHQQQWDLGFMLKHFTKIITYWEPIIKMSLQLDNRISYFPFIHRFDFGNPNDMALIKENTNQGKKVCIVLEKRDLKGEYQINGVTLHAQDYLRWEYASKLGKRIDCYGKTWEQHKDIIQYREAKNRFLDEESVIDIMEKYTFALIIENCDADGYVSEKIYDALTVGCIPLYYGNNNKRLGIPEDCYIDLKGINPEVLPGLIDGMDSGFIDMFRKNIYKKRMDVLEKAGVKRYNKII